MKILKVFGLIIFIISLIFSFMLIIDLIKYGDLYGRYRSWELILVFISFSLSIAGFGYLFRKTLFKGNNFTKLIIIILVILLGVYVWPTPYRNMPYRGSIPFRIHRITGTGEVWFRGTGWTKLK